MKNSNYAIYAFGEWNGSDRHRLSVEGVFDLGRIEELANYKLFRVKGSGLFGILVAHDYLIWNSPRCILCHYPLFSVLSYE